MLLMQPHVFLIQLTYDKLYLQWFCETKQQITFKHFICSEYNKYFLSLFIAKTTHDPEQLI